MVERPNDGAWFAAKRFGIGAGLAIAWQGWALLGGYITAIFLLAWLVAAGGVAIKALAILLFTVATGLFVEISRRHTRGGWKWRWGKDD